MKINAYYRHVNRTSNGATFLSYKTLAECLSDLEGRGELVRIKAKVDPNGEVSEIHRKISSSKGPAILFENIAGSQFPALSNLFGTMERAKYIFRRSLTDVKKVVELKADPVQALRNPIRYWKAPFSGLMSLPLPVGRARLKEFEEVSVSDLPQIKSWPMDGGPFITLPQVFSMDPSKSSIFASNLGMYRVQMAGGEYETNSEVGLHYQIHRGIGQHHAIAGERNEPLKVSIFVGGPPAHTLSAIMPLPEGLSELVFAGLLAKRNFRYLRWNGYVISADADFCILGTIDPKETKVEGPFGDHLGYYSLKHEFPYLKVEKVLAKKQAIWPFTVVGRPPQEDSVFGSLIHEITKPMVPVSLPGVKALHAVDLAGVHPLLLAMGRETYTPYKKPNRPQELLTLAHSILGFGQCSLAKYLIIMADPNGGLNIHDEKEVFRHVLERVDLSNDLHFHTKTTIDTLDYSGEGFNEGSKLVIACGNKKLRNLAADLRDFDNLPVQTPKVVCPGILAISGPEFSEEGYSYMERLEKLLPEDLGSKFPLVVVCDDSEFVAKDFGNFLWVAFTRSNPSHDVWGVGSSIEFKHWGCKGSVLIDARVKSHHAPVLKPDPNFVAKAENTIRSTPNLLPYL